MENAKTCAKCKKVKPFTQFNKCSANKDDLSYWCKECFKRYEKTAEIKRTRKRYSKTNNRKISSNHYYYSEKGKLADKRYRKSKKCKDTTKRYCIRHPEYHKAQNAVRIAIQERKVPRPDSLLCHYCPKPAQEYHHWHGYEKEHWLDVIPVCKDCHKEYKKNSLKLAVIGIQSKPFKDE